MLMHSSDLVFSGPLSEPVPATKDEVNQSWYRVMILMVIVMLLVKSDCFPSQPEISFHIAEIQAKKRKHFFASFDFLILVLWLYDWQLELFIDFLFVYWFPQRFP